MHTSATKNHKARKTLLAVAVAAVASLGAMNALAASLYWAPNSGLGGAGATPTGNWDTTTTAWNTSADGSGSASTWVDSSDVIFTAGVSGTDAINPYLVTYTGPINANSISNVMTGALTIDSSASGNVLNLGAGGITMNAGAGAMTIGSSNLTLTLSAAQTWLNNSSNLLTVNALNANGHGLILDGTGNTKVTGIAGGTTLTKNGTGTVLLNGADTLAGAISVNLGSLQLGNTLALGAGTNAVTVAAGATLDLNGISPTNNNALAITGQLSSTVGALTNSNGTSATYGGATTIGTGGASIGGSGGITLSGLVSGAALTKVGSGTLTLSNSVANTFTGTININSGTLRYSADNQLGTGANAVVMSGGTTLAATGTTTTARALTLPRDA